MSLTSTPIDTLSVLAWLQFLFWHLDLITDVNDWLLGLCCKGGRKPLACQARCESGKQVERKIDTHAVLQARGLCSEHLQIGPKAFPISRHSCSHRTCTGVRGYLRSFVSSNPILFCTWPASGLMQLFDTWRVYPLAGIFEHIWNVIWLIGFEVEGQSAFGLKLRQMVLVDV